MEREPMDHDPEYDPIEHEPRRLGRRARWAVPAVALLATAGVIAGTTMAGAQAAPSLPARSAATLLADVQRATGPGPMTATIQETASLGLPALPGSGAGGPGSGDLGSGLSLLSGSHAFRIWYADPAHVRLAQAVQLGESDVRVNGRQVWQWNSKTQTATHIVLPQRRHRFFPGRPGQGMAGPDRHPGRWDGGPAPTPQQAARRFLALVGPTTTVSVQRNVSVAGQDAYQISLAPKDSRSLVGQIRIAIDATRFYPLRVQVFARGSASPAFQIGYTSITLGRPAASNFTFTPPPGAKVKTVSPPAAPPESRGYMPGQRGWSGTPPKPGPHGSLFAKPSPPPNPSDPFMDNRPVGGLARPTVMGKGWLSVLVLQPGAPFDGQTTYTTYGSHSPGDSRATTITLSPDTGTLPAGAGPGILRALLRAATPVHGAWGSGHLLRTSLVSVLITSKGTVLIGAVTPSVLYADAAAIK
jgi:hypothetical protein